MSGGNIKVVVRCRPLNAREKARGAECLVRMEGNQTILSRSSDSRTGKESEDHKAFTFDKSYWSADPNDPSYATQEMVFNDLGVDLLNHAFDDGQTGSGKSYSMMGYGDEHGITPRTCSALFERINRNTSPSTTYCVEVTYIEIYNEKVRDLLNPKNSGNLKVREHPSLGPYVEDLRRLAVKSFEDINHLMDEGNKARTVAATNMNETSSRSHAVFTLFLTQKHRDELTNLETEKVARISLVDLAGSERANSTGATGARLKEGANINRSLTTLGLVISGLAEQASSESKKGAKGKGFIPYRDSVLTWLLKDSLGGNSKTAMIAAISPADYDETLSTLRYADQAKKIKNKAVVNEDPNARLIRELKDELNLLRDRLRIYAPEDVGQLTAASAYQKGSYSGSTSLSAPSPTVSTSTSPNQLFEITDSKGNTKKMSKQEIIEQWQTARKLLDNLNETWEEKVKRTREIQKERESALEELGIAIHKTNVGVYTPKKIPHLVNLNEDPLMSECLVYQLKPGITKVGSLESETPSDIKLSGPNILDEHCWFENNGGAVTIHPKNNSVVMVNGMRISESQRLRSGFRIILGDYHIFRFNNPEEVRKERGLIKTAVEKSMGRVTPSLEDDERPQTPTESTSMVGSEIIDWNYARREAVLNYYANEINFSGMKDEDLEKLYDDITRIRDSRRIRSESRNESYDDYSPRHSFRNSLTATVVEDRRESICTEATFVQNDLEEKFKVETEKLKKELDAQKQRYEAKIHRMSQQFLLNGTCGYSDQQQQLMQKVANQWKKLRYVTMAEVALTHAVLLKEANIISRKLNKDVLYQFAIIEDGQFTNPMSSWETSVSSHSCATDKDTALWSTPKPSIGVRVIDRKHQVVYVWSLEKLKARLDRMRDLYTAVERPLYRSPFHLEDPFFEDPCPTYSFIGSATTSMRNLAFGQPYESYIHVICRATGQIMGNLRVLISPIARSTAATDPENGPSAIEDGSDANGIDRLQVGQQILFEIRFLELSGLSESMYSHVHVQFRLSSLGGIPENSTLEKVFATNPISGFNDGPIQFDHCESLSIVVSQQVMDVLLHGMISFELYGVAQPDALSHYERWDDQREKPRLADLLATKQKKRSSTGSRLRDHWSVHYRHSPKGGLERRTKDELLATERHDIVAWIQICELSSHGDYTPVAVSSHNALDKGVFCLRQGLQRRIRLTLSHTSGHQLEWSRITKAFVGRVRLVDPKGRIMDSPPHDDIPIKLLHKQSVVYNKDGTSQLVAQGAWDSSQHESLFLDRITAANSRVLLNLAWEVEADKCSKPIPFNMDIAVQIQGRGSLGKSRLRKLLDSDRHLPKCSGLFLLKLRPPMTRRLSQLWQLNTASKYVCGEEQLGSWRPRGVSLVNDYKHIQERIRRLQQVAFTTQVLALRAARLQTSDGSMKLEKTGDASTKSSGKTDMSTLTEAQSALLQKVLALWSRKQATSNDLVISQDPPIPGMATQAAHREPLRVPKLLAEVKQITQTDHVTKKGYLGYQENALDDKWVKRWFVIRRPYMYIYTNQSEKDEQGVINLSSVRVDYNRALEQMIQRLNVLAVYTNNNAYTLQAPSRSDMIDWVSKIDPTYPIDKLKKGTL